MTLNKLRAIEVITHHIVSKGLNDALVKLVDQLQKESGDPGYHDEPATVGVTYCLDCDYRQPDPDKWERLADMADDVYDREREGFGSTDQWNRQLSEAN